MAPLIRSDEPFGGPEAFRADFGITKALGRDRPLGRTVPTLWFRQNSLTFHSDEAEPLSSGGFSYPGWRRRSSKVHMLHRVP